MNRPRRTQTLAKRRVALADPALQLAMLDALDLPGGDFEDQLRHSGHEGLRPGPFRVLQLNLGKLCNMACLHCHVDAGPDRIAQNMSTETAEACMQAIERLQPQTVDLTGGAPELNPNFRRIVAHCHRSGVQVIDRCNLSVLLLAKNADLIPFLAEHQVEVVASLPHPRPRNTDAQRGDGAFNRSIEALRRLNAAGYGTGDPSCRLTLVHNPAGAFLPASQAALEQDYKRVLDRDHGVSFDRLIALTNMPISRFLEWLDTSGNLEPYMRRLVSEFNPATLEGLMCRDTISVGWDGRVYDCDFNQMLNMTSAIARPHIADLDLPVWSAHAIRTARHCFGCTAGAGSSCAGATT
ncbi:MAG: radical SAM/Cys-rich domain protein [Deltaproteobacteria bacterium]|nr:MAG: radical SAM/Cys-rich domain protein [Deltaproteobacteria bacterium]